MASTTTSVSVRTVILEATVKSISMNVVAAHVSTVHVLTISIPTAVLVMLAGPELTVMLT